MLGEPADDLEALLLVEAAQVAAGVVCQPVARRDQAAEVHASIAEAIPVAAYHEAELTEPEGKRGARGGPDAEPRRLPDARGQQGESPQQAGVCRDQRRRT